MIGIIVCSIGKRKSLGFTCWLGVGSVQEFDYNVSHDDRIRISDSISVDSGLRRICLGLFVFVESAAMVELVALPN